MTRRGDWRHHAACSGAPVDIFFPTKDEYGSGLLAARVYCDTCPLWVQERCVTQSVEIRDFDGIRGGLSGEDRRRLAEGRTETNTRTRPWMALTLEERQEVLDVRRSQRRAAPVRRKQRKTNVPRAG